ncbi:MAG: hypothetical protein U0165_00270 [Polyangiaceae bacterium]
MSTSTTSRALFASLAALSFLVTTPATAAPTATEPSSTDTTAPARTSEFHADFEVDPTAYVLDGYSLHVGLGQGRFRLDLGAFAMKVPGAIHGNKASTSRSTALAREASLLLLRRAKTPVCWHRRRLQPHARQAQGL